MQFEATISRYTVWYIYQGIHTYIRAASWKRLPCLYVIAVAAVVGNSMSTICNTYLKIGRYWISRMLNNIQHRFVEHVWISVIASERERDTDDVH